MEDMVVQAIKKNVKILAFTDHVDYEYGADSLNFLFDLNDYLKEFKRLKSKYNKDIEILSGVELGMQPHLSNRIPKLIDLNIFDFVIMSIHTAKGQELHEGSFFTGKTTVKAYTEYYEDLLLTLEKFNDFDTVGHLNLIDRYVKYTDNVVEIEEYQDLLVKVLQKIITLGKGIEINTSGIRYGINSFLPNIKILNLYRDLGGEIITIGSDAHKPDDISSGYKDGIELLKELKFKYLTIYKNRKKHQIKIE